MPVTVHPAPANGTFRVVNHGADANVERPAGAVAVYWVGSVTPANAQDQDIWYDTDETGPATIRPIDDIWIPASDMDALAGTPQFVNENGSVGVVLMDSAVVERVGATVKVPVHWTTYDVTLWWYNQGAGAGDVQWRYNRLEFGAGTTIGAVTQESSVTVTASAQDVVVTTTLASGVAVPTSSQRLSASVLRNGAAADDTLGNDAGVIAIQLTKAS